MRERLKDQVVALLCAGDARALAELVAADRRVVRLLVGRLWDPDPAVGHRAARALGEAAVHHEALVRETVRKLLWALNDESGTNGAPALAALGEIGRRSPALIAPHVGAMAAMAADEGLREAVTEALNAFGASEPES